MDLESALNLRWIQIQHGGGTDDLLGNFWSSETTSQTVKQFRKVLGTVFCCYRKYFAAEMSRDAVYPGSLGTTNHSLLGVVVGRFVYIRGLTQGSTFIARDC